MFSITSSHCKPTSLYYRGTQCAHWAAVNRGGDGVSCLPHCLRDGGGITPCLTSFYGSPVTLQTKSKDFAEPAKPHRTWLPAPSGPSSRSTHSLPALPPCTSATRHPCCSLTCQVCPHLRFSLLERSFSSCHRSLPHFIHKSAQMPPLQRGVPPSKIAPHQWYHLCYHFFMACLSTSNHCIFTCLFIASPTRIKLCEAGLLYFIYCYIPGYS